MKDIPKISEAEWEVMKVVWSNSPCSSSEITEAIKDNTNWKPKTVKTLISRLVDKGVLAFKEDGRRYLYYPLIEESKCVKAENESFLKRVYNGAVKSMLVSFIKESDLSDEDIRELKHILDERK